MSDCRAHTRAASRTFVCLGPQRLCNARCRCPCGHRDVPDFLLFGLFGPSFRLEAGVYGCKAPDHTTTITQSQPVAFTCQARGSWQSAAPVRPAAGLYVKSRYLTRLPPDCQCEHPAAFPSSVLKDSACCPPGMRLSLGWLTCRADGTVPCSLCRSSRRRWAR